MQQNQNPSTKWWKQCKKNAKKPKPNIKIIENKNIKWKRWKKCMLFIYVQLKKLKKKNQEKIDEKKIKNKNLK